MAHELVTSVHLYEKTSTIARDGGNYVGSPDGFGLIILPKDHVTVMDTENNKYLGNGSITLQTKVQNVLTGGIFVGLYSRVTKKLVRIGTSDVNGNIIFNNVLTEADSFFAVSLTDTVYNGLVIDRLEGV